MITFDHHPRASLNILNDYKRALQSSTQDARRHFRKQYQEMVCQSLGNEAMFDLNNALSYEKIEALDKRSRA